MFSHFSQQLTHPPEDGGLLPSWLDDNAARTPLPGPGPSTLPQYRSAQGYFHHTAALGAQAHAPFLQLASASHALPALQIPIPPATRAPMHHGRVPYRPTPMETMTMQAIPQRSQFRTAQQSYYLVPSKAQPSRSTLDTPQTQSAKYLMEPRGAYRRFSGSDPFIGSCRTPSPQHLLRFGGQVMGMQAQSLQGGTIIDPDNLSRVDLEQFDLSASGIEHDEDGCSASDADVPSSVVSLSSLGGDIDEYLLAEAPDMFDTYQGEDVYLPMETGSPKISDQNGFDNILRPSDFYNKYDKLFPSSMLPEQVDVGHISRDIDAYGAIDSLGSNATVFSTEEHRPGSGNVSDQDSFLQRSPDPCFPIDVDAEGSAEPHEFATPILDTSTSFGEPTSSEAACGNVNVEQSCGAKTVHWAPNPTSIGASQVELHSSRLVQGRPRSETRWQDDHSELSLCSPDSMSMAESTTDDDIHKLPYLSALPPPTIGTSSKATIVVPGSSEVDPVDVTGPLEDLPQEIRRILPKNWFALEDTVSKMNESISASSALKMCQNTMNDLRKMLGEFKVDTDALDQQLFEMVFQSKRDEAYDQHDSADDSDEEYQSSDSSGYSSHSEYGSLRKASRARQPGPLQPRVKRRKLGEDPVLPTPIKTPTVQKRRNSSGALLEGTQQGSPLTRVRLSMPATPITPSSPLTKGLAPPRSPGDSSHYFTSDEGENDDDPLRTIASSSPKGLQVRLPRALRGTGYEDQVRSELIASQSAEQRATLDSVASSSRTSGKAAIKSGSARQTSASKRRSMKARKR
ncbi:uncharacterized protein EV422DRAFT_503814 [Fimicolochytrium jonesii]|uniref:uncharacterized protein n=1 Tax=Fimicolochytrium jonesii TaxID=1396493 RepID=UPI0022FF212C|nr:uncharacterized protein EV422DRAFT_503814 [Fimicolochytrium jonesii]KAI8825048.1 hypothetical protein EV422DRAFT_503814 [Fimicolochytrium jonesii]